MNADNLQVLLPLLRCPNCYVDTFVVSNDGTNLNCKACGDQFPISSGRPVLLQPDNDLFCQDDYRNIKLPVLAQSSRSWQSFIPSPSVNLASQRVLSRVRALLEKIPSATVLL